MSYQLSDVKRKAQILPGVDFEENFHFFHFVEKRGNNN